VAPVSAVSLVPDRAERHFGPVPVSATLGQDRVLGGDGGPGVPVGEQLPLPRTARGFRRTCCVFGHVAHQRRPVRTAFGHFAQLC
jgi:hypothetical protein